MDINITVNGESRAMLPDSTVLSLLEALGLNPRAVAVELNGDILGRERFAETPLAEGDRLELVRFVGGG